MKYILLTALRDWLFSMLMLGILVCTLIAHMLGGTALIENQEMTVSFTSAAVRGVVVIGLIIFACFHVRSAFDSKEIDVFLSRPITRTNLVFSYWLGFGAVATLLTIPMLGLVAVQGIMNMKGFIFWGVSLLVECWLVVTIALFASFTLRSAVTSTLASMGFYAFARLAGFFLAIIDADSKSGWLSGAPGKILKMITAIVPRLDFFARSDWLIYGLKQVGEWEFLVAQAVAVIALLLLATVVDFRRRQF
ncbi:MAG TPA: hypothetical protein VFT64_10960 [Rickettsiales bacterium]|nr:hypothetical protein [Rickettsiales bacterium]